MSSALAIAGITQVLKDLLNDGIINNVTSVTGTAVSVTALPPDRVESMGEQSQLNLYMYQATINQGWRNEALPVFDSGGGRVSNPPLALNLHYLLTAHTAGPELHTEILLGYGMQLLHAHPVLTREEIRLSLSPPDNVDLEGLPPVLQALATSGLDGQLEQITITPEPLGLEDLSKLWTAFSTKYRPTAAYKVTVVLIQNERSLKKALPVQRRNIYSLPFKEPLIEAIDSVPAPGQPVMTPQPVFAGATLLLRGKRLLNHTVLVKIGHTEVPVEAANSAADLIKISLPGDLPAGLQSLQVVHPVNMGTPEIPHKGMVSKVQPFILTPLVVAAPQENGSVINGNYTGMVQLRLNPAVTEKQGTRILLNGTGTNTRAYSFERTPATPGSAPEEVIRFPVKGVFPGTYLVRVQVAGAESPLETDNGTGLFSKPVVSLT